MLPLLSLALLAPTADPFPTLDQRPNTWVKRSPLPDGPPSPGLGYECSLVWDGKHRRTVRFAGHNQGGGGEQNAETWAFDPLSAKWELKEPNTSPPGACCNQQNVFDLDQKRFIRFPAFSGSHGWQWFREIYLNNSTAWNYDLGTNTWRDRRPLPAPRIAPLRCASWDSDHQVAVVFGGEGSSEGTLVYDPYTNTWHRLNPKVQPEPRSGGNMAYDAAAKRHILFGTQFGDDRHTWAFDLRKCEWTDLKPKSQPPTDRNDPVLAYDANAKKVIALVRVIDKQEKDEVLAGHLETWAYDSAVNTWTETSPAREPEGWGNRRRVMVAMPELNALLMEAYVNPTEKVKGVDREQQMWTYRTADSKPVEAVLPPGFAWISTFKDGEIHLTWGAVAGASGYLISRGIGDTPWTAGFKEVAKVASDKTTFAERGVDVPRGQVLYYRVAALSKDGTESASSPVLRAQPRAPETVRVASFAPTKVRVQWQPVGSPAGFHIERAAVEVFSEDQVVRLKKDTTPLDQPSVGAIAKIGKFKRLTKDAIAVNQADYDVYLDTAVDLTKPTTVEGEALYTHRFAKEQIDTTGKPYRYGVYAYRVISVNELGIESGPSAYALTIPAAAQDVFAKEDGEKCHLKWTKNIDIEPGVKGYRVYRMEGPKVNGPGQPVTRLTTEPITGSAFTDEKATKETKRYWIVAVDAIGQEGHPSAPAWHWRQFRSSYEPFTGEWHQ